MTDDADTQQHLRDLLGALRYGGLDDDEVAELVERLHGTPWDACIPMCPFVRIYRSGGVYVTTHSSEATSA